MVFVGMAGIVKLGAKFNNCLDEEISVKPFKELMPDIDALLRLQPEELGAVLLEHINTWPEENLTHLGWHNTVSMIALQYEGRREEIKRPLTEAWVWLENEGFLAPRPGTARDFSFITRKGKQFTAARQLESYRKMKLLAGSLHPRIDEKARAAFLRAEYGPAIFEGFKEVEVAVREAAGAAATDLGVDLMNSAFKPNVGPLTDRSLPESEQIALRNLFAGAIGYYKNPGSHRHVPADPEAAAGVLVFASVLLRIVDERAASRTTAASAAAPQP